MPDRLAELVRQRALVQEHLAWLNREIAAAAEAAKVAPPAAPAPAAIVPPTALPADSTRTVTPPPAAAPELASTPDGDEIIARYQVSPVAMKQDIRKGCLLYFAGAFVLLGVVVMVLYFVLSTRR